MSTISEAELQAYVDGQLAPADTARVEAVIAGDPGLARQLDRERALRARLRGAFDPVLDEPMPARFAALLQGGQVGKPDQHEEANVAATNVVDLAQRRRPAWRAPAYALAASLLVLAASLWLRNASGPVRMQGDRLMASGELAHALDDALASAPQAHAPVAIGLSFRAQDGRVCRSFTRGALAGLACREGDAWTIAVLSHAAGNAADIRQAGSALPPEVRAAIDARMQGDAFDAAQERAARDAGWR